jgi:hypothetical protein
LISYSWIAAIDLELAKKFLLFTSAPPIPQCVASQLPPSVGDPRSLSVELIRNPVKVEKFFALNALAAHDAAVQMIDTSIVRVHQFGGCITRSQRQSVGRSRDELTGKNYALVGQPWPSGTAGAEPRRGSRQSVRRQAPVLPIIMELPAGSITVTMSRPPKESRHRSAPAK